MDISSGVDYGLENVKRRPTATQFNSDKETTISDCFDEYMDDIQKKLELNPADPNVSQKHSRASIATTVMSIFTTFYMIWFPGEVVFDELHFGKFAGHYLQRSFYLDIHPPLAKMTLAFWSLLIGFNGIYEFDHIGDSYVQYNVPYVPMRALSASYNVMSVVLIYQIMRETGGSVLTCFLTASLYLLDNAFICQSRLMLMDSTLIFYMLTTIYSYIRFRKYRHVSFTRPWWKWLCMTGFCMGLTASVKLVGVFTTASIGISVMIDLWDLLNSRYRLKKRKIAQHFLARAVTLITIPVCTYMFLFYIHFFVQSTAGPGSITMSHTFRDALYESPLAKHSVALEYGHVVLLQNDKTGAYLHSYAQNYPDHYENGGESSKGQIVVGTHTADENSYWRLLHPHRSTRKHWSDAFNPNPENQDDDGYSEEEIDRMFNNVPPPVHHVHDDEDSHDNDENPHHRNYIRLDHDGNPLPLDYKPVEPENKLFPPPPEMPPQFDMNHPGMHAGHFGTEYLMDVPTENNFMAGAEVVFQHVATGGRLVLNINVGAYSDHEMKEFSVTSDPERRDETIFRVNFCDEDGFLWRSVIESVRIMHIPDGLGLVVNPRQLPAWGNHQLEIYGEMFRKNDTFSWTVTRVMGVDAQAINSGKKLRPPGRTSFWEKFSEVHERMFEESKKLADVQPFESKPSSWPLLKRGVNYWTSRDSTNQIYMTGNVAGWWGGFACIMLFVGVYSLDKMLKKRGMVLLRPTSRIRLHRTGGFFFLLWCTHYFPFFFLKGSFYLHHYLPAMTCNYLLVGSMFEYIFVNGVNSPISYQPHLKRHTLDRARSTFKSYLAASMIMGMQFFVYLFLSPLTYGAPALSSDQATQRRILKSWDPQFAKYS